MGFADYYLNRQKPIVRHIADSPSAKLGFIVVIPAYCEPGLQLVLNSLWNCTRPQSDAEVIVVVNSSENAGEEIRKVNRETIVKTQEWIQYHQDPSLRFFILHADQLPAKHSGAGLARKTGMDEAVYRFNFLNNTHGFILSLDADSTVDPDYFIAIERSLHDDTRIMGFDIYFEHPVQGTEFSGEVYQSITEYELHLRYVNMFMKITGFPYAHHTVGSCFGVRGDIYAAQGGMNKRKGGEDFYFLHKIIPLGHFVDINTTRVIPSPRESFRVPFGTGPAITKRISGGMEMLTYAPENFYALKQLFDLLHGFYKTSPEEIETGLTSLPVALREFLTTNNIHGALKEISDNTGSPESFINRFFRWFDAFRMVKFLNFASIGYYPKVQVTYAAGVLLKLLGYPETNAGAVHYLEIMRNIERSGVMFDL